MNHDSDPVPHHITVPRTARYYISGHLTAQTRDIWIVCHGYAQSAARFLRHFSSLTSDSRCIVAPEALSRFYVTPEMPHGADSRVGASWMTREDRENEINDTINYLDSLHRELVNKVQGNGGNPKSLRTHILGFSQGGAAAARWFVRGDIECQHLVLWGSYLPPDINIDSLKSRSPELHIDFVAGDSDLSIEQNLLQQQVAAFRASGISADVTVFSGGHKIHIETLKGILEFNGQQK